MESGKPIYIFVLFVIVVVCLFVLFGNIVFLKIKLQLTHFLLCIFQCVGNYGEFVFGVSLEMTVIRYCYFMGCSFARTTLFCIVGCRREMKRGDVKCSFW